MARETILVVEDDRDIQELVQFHLQREGYVVQLADSVEQARQRLERNLPALAILDLMLPGESGFDFCRALRRDPRTRTLPVVMLTARDEAADVVAGLEVGADDYVTKPFSPRILLARVRAVLRRHAPEEAAEAPLIERGAIVIDREHHVVRVAGREPTLTLSEFRILELLARRPGVVFTRYQIVDAVHGSDYPVTDRSVDVQLVGLRRKLGKHGALLETVRGVGYRFKAAADDGAPSDGGKS